MSIAVIPARGGSRRIPRKNVREFAGQPIIGWSIQAAQDACCFSRIIVSTDDEEIADVARALGAEVPFMRPAELADDHATTGAVMSHAVAELLGADAPESELICCIYPAAPFVTPEDLLKGLEILSTETWDYVFPVTRFAYPIQRALRVHAEGGVTMFNPEHLLTRSQDLEESFHDAGQFYWGRAAAFLQQRPVYSDQATVMILPRYRAIDIDTPEDWQTAELSWRAQRMDSV